MLMQSSINHMARKKQARKSASKRTRKHAEEESEDVEEESSIRSETMRGVWGVLAIAVAVFFVLAGFDLAGVVGRTLFSWLSTLFGIGYILVPVSFLLLAIALFRAFEHRLGALKAAGAFLFFLSGLAFIETLFPDQGGIIGTLLSTPLTYAIDTVATVVVLLAIIVAALLLVFDAHPQQAFPTVRRLFERREKEEDEDVLGEDEEAAIDAGTKQVDAEEAAAPPNDESAKSADEESRGIFNFGKGSGVGGLFSFSSSAQSAYTPPPLSLLERDSGKPSVGDVKASANTIKRTLQNFGIDVEMDEVSIGPSVTRYAMKPAEGVRLAKIVSLQSNLELALAASPIRIEAPIPGKSLVGVEVPNTVKSTLGLASLIGDADFQNSDKPLLIALGRDITGVPHYANIARMPHLLIAGTTGAGKSVTIHDTIVSLLYRRSPQDLRLVLVDPKRVELTLYNNIPHLLTPVITDAKKAILALKWLAKEMDRRYDILEAEAVRDIASYHKNIYDPALAKIAKAEQAKRDDDQGHDSALSAPEPMPYIVTVIDEMADLMSAYPRELEAAVVRLAQMSRAVGIHLVLSTQRPSVQIITGLIKANIPARIALQVSSQIDSRTILDMGGAEKLLGAGDMLFMSGEMSRPRRIQAPFISEHEVKKVVKYLRDAHEYELPDEIDLTEVQHDNTIFSSSVEEDDDDDLYEEAREIVIEAGKASTSYLQRKLRIGYARAARLVDMLEERGVIGAADGSRPREVLNKGESSNAGEEEQER
jgi:S-DNA-T family DNA segregation ATPase FtsK/SpoIIIE